MWNTFFFSAKNQKRVFVVLTTETTFYAHNILMGMQFLIKRFVNKWIKSKITATETKRVNVDLRIWIQIEIEANINGWSDDLDDGTFSIHLRDPTKYQLVLSYLFLRKISNPFNQEKGKKPQKTIQQQQQQKKKLTTKGGTTNFQKQIWTCERNGYNALRLLIAAGISQFPNLWAILVIVGNRLNNVPDSRQSVSAHYIPTH